MERRDFFRRAAQKVSKVAVEGADAQAERAAGRWIRPPYARRELDFLLACTRCGACIDACPHQVVFALPARLGARVAGTPALDLINNACHLCRDWPCITACEAGALDRGEDGGATDEVSLLPAIARVRVDASTCLPYSGPECGACRGACPVPGAMVWEMERPRVVAAHCVGCGLCREACITAPKAITVESKYKASPAPASHTASIRE